jgi:nicotinate dehydrogenase subunit A
MSVEGPAEAVQFSINGAPHRYAGAGDMTLLEVLRDQLDLKGSRFGCGQGLCGACTVIHDGRAIFACATPMWSLADARIETIEGIANSDDLHPIQQAILEHQAGQCGYCLPGIIMRAKAFFSERPAATRAEIAEALQRNLCRCGAHQRILDALEDARDRMRTEAAR